MTVVLKTIGTPSRYKGQKRLRRRFYTVTLGSAHQTINFLSNISNIIVVIVFITIMMSESKIAFISQNCSEFGSIRKNYDTV